MIFYDNPQNNLKEKISLVFFNWNADDANWADFR